MTYETDFSEAFPRDILLRMVALEGNQTLTDALISMQIERGIDEEAAREHAAACILASAARDSLFEQVCDDSGEVLKRFLAGLSRLEEGDHILALHKIHFGMTAWNDPETARRLEQGTSAEQLFWAYYDGQVNGEHPLTIPELEEQVRSDLAACRLSPAALRALTGNMRRGDRYLATARALGEQGRNLKALMTMELWLRSPDTMSMEEAANAAAASVETQAIADALQRRYVTRDVAKKLLLAVGIAVALFGAVYLIQSAPAVSAAFARLKAVPGPDVLGMSPLLKSFLAKQASASHLSGLLVQGKGVLFAALGGAMVFLSDKGAELIADFTSGVPLLRKEAPVADAGFEALAEELDDREEIPLTDPESMEEIPGLSESDLEPDAIRF